MHHRSIRATYRKDISQLILVLASHDVGNILGYGVLGVTVRSNSSLRIDEAKLGLLIGRLQRQRHKFEPIEEMSVGHWTPWVEIDDVQSSLHRTVAYSLLQSNVIEILTDSLR